MHENNIIIRGRELPQKINLLFDDNKIFQKLISSTNSIEIGTFRTFDFTSLTQITTELSEIDRSVAVFGRKNSQTTNKLMSIVMMHGTDPYRSLRQCIAEITNRRSAIRETYYNIKRKCLQISDGVKSYDDLPDGFEKDMFAIDLESLIAETVETINYFEGAIKDISNFLDAYNQIKKSYNIPENWDETDYEASEIYGHVRHAFMLGYTNIITCGVIDGATVEYLHQFGIHPQRASEDIIKYVENNTEDDYEGLESWLDQMVKKYGNEYIKAMKRIGLTTLIDERSQYKGRRNYE